MSEDTSQLSSLQTIGCIQGVEPKNLCLLNILQSKFCCRSVHLYLVEYFMYSYVSLSNSRADEKTEKEKKRHSASPGKGKHVSPKVMFVHHDDPKVEDNLRIRGKCAFTDFSTVFITFG